jgi:hypothetical protein
MISNLAERLERLAANVSSPGFNPSVLRNSGIGGASEKAVLNKVHKNPGGEMRNGCKN